MEDDNDETQARNIAMMEEFLQSLDSIENDDNRRDISMTDELISACGKRRKLNPEEAADKAEVDIEKTKVEIFQNGVGKRTTYKARLRAVWHNRKLSDHLRAFTDVIAAILLRAREDGSGEDLSVIVLENDGLVPVAVPIRRLDEMDVSVVCDTVVGVLQSHQDLVVDPNLTITVGILKNLKGRGRLSRHSVTATDLKKRFRSIRWIDNVKDINSCLYLSITASWVTSLNVRETNKYGSETLDGLARTLLADKFITRKNLSEIIRYGKRDFHLRRLAREICTRAGVNYDQPGHMTDIPKFETFLNAKIVVIKAGEGCDVIRVGDYQSTKTLFICVMPTDTIDLHHYCSIKNIRAFFNSNFCDICSKPYSDQYPHNCKKKCHECGSEGCVPEPGVFRLCTACQITFTSDECYATHLVGGEKSMCSRRFKCPDCKKHCFRNDKTTGEKHRCHYVTCRKCFKQVVDGHLCYNRAAAPSADISRFRYCFFDFECRQEDDIQCIEGYSPNNPRGCESLCTDSPVLCSKCRKCKNCNDSTCGQKEHLVNFVVAQMCCDMCADFTEKPVDSTCTNCGSACSACLKLKPRRIYSCGHCCKRQVVFKGEEALNEFMGWLLKQSEYRSQRMSQEKSVPFYAFAHNLSGYDAHFIVNYLMKRNMRPTVTYTGLKILKMCYGSLTFVDSLSMTHMPLSKLPKAFDLSEGSCKGMFPHFFNTRANETYVGPYPEPRFYDPDGMTETGKEAFTTWYESVKHECFDFQKEILNYCEMDVSILRQAIIKLRSMFAECCHIDMFANSVTIASLCLRIFRTNYMTEQWTGTLADGNVIDVSKKIGRFYNHTGLDVTEDLVTKTFEKSDIGEIPTGGYSMRIRSSRKASAWLAWVGQEEGRVLLHTGCTGSYGEYRIPGTRYHVDGYDPSTRTVFEFDGCLFHSCVDCVGELGINPLLKLPHKTVRDRTVKKRAKIIADGYEIVTMRECVFDRRRKEDPRFDAFVKDYHCVPRLKVRDGFFGGRCAPIMTYYKPSEDETIEYVDYCSLYPSIQKQKRFPVGHPTIILDNFKPIQEYFGMVYLTILPPKQLMFPVLPSRINGKLCFTLCRTCAEAKTPPPCLCPDGERVLEGTWCTVEVARAVELGYVVQQIYEVHHFPESKCFNPQTGDAGLFSEYVNFFLKIKQESSGPPSWVQNDEDLHRYIELYREHENIDMDPLKIKKNPGLRALSKLCLNALWGKIGQSPDSVQTKFITKENLSDLYDLMSSHIYVLVNFEIMSADVMLVSYKEKDVYERHVPNTNVYLACLTTAYARLKLHRDMHSLGEAVIYTDTDSIIYVKKIGDVGLPLGDYLGDLTDELPSGSKITEFVSVAPKTYAYRLVDGDGNNSTVVKCKGFRLSYLNAQKITFDSLKTLLDDECAITTVQKKIYRKKPSLITTGSEYKRLHVQLTKRHYDPLTYHSRPFGYNDGATVSRR